MQIRELELSEIYSAYEMVQHLYNDLSFKEFEDLIYQMRKENYKQFALYEKEHILLYSIIKIDINLRFKKYLKIENIICSIKDKNLHSVVEEMLLFLSDYAKINNCETIVYNSENKNEQYEKVIKEEFNKNSTIYWKQVSM